MKAPNSRSRFSRVALLACLTSATAACAAEPSEVSPSGELAQVNGEKAAALSVESGEESRVNRDDRDDRDDLDGRVDRDGPYPIVLFHGMGGFKTLELGPIEISYWNGVAEDLASRGNAVFVTIAPPFDTSEERAEALSKQVDWVLARTGKKKVNIIAHSQGGLDARVIASPQGLHYGRRVASVTTVATPHRGSKIADAVLDLLRLVPPELIDGVTGAVLGVLQKAVYGVQRDPRLRAQVTELSEKYMAEVFNPKYRNARSVRYTSYAGRTNFQTGIGPCDDGVSWNNPFQVAFSPLHVATALFLEEGRFKANDGAVTVESAKWGQFQRCVPADHMSEVGQRTPFASEFDHVGLFREIVADLRDHGL